MIQGVFTESTGSKMVENDNKKYNNLQAVLGYFTVIFIQNCHEGFRAENAASEKKSKTVLGKRRKHLGEKKNGDKTGRKNERQPVNQPASQPRTRWAPLSFYALSSRSKTPNKKQQMMMRDLTVMFF